MDEGPPDTAPDYYPEMGPEMEPEYGPDLGPEVPPPPRARRQNNRGNGSTAGGKAPAVREPPHSMDLERAVLAVLLQGDHATAIHTVREKLPHALAFFDRDHRLIYQACLDLDDVGHRIDPAAIADHLQKSDFQVCVRRFRQQQALSDANQLDGMGRDRLRSLYQFRDEDAAQGYDQSVLAAIGGFARLAELTGAYATAAGLGANAAGIWDHYLKRRLIAKLNGIADSAYRTTDQFQQLIDLASGEVLNLSRESQNASVWSVDVVVDDTLKAIGEKQTNPESGVKTGIRGVDDRLMCLRPGGLYVLAARPGVGKTSFALGVVNHVLEHWPEEHVLFFSLEVDRVDLVKKLLSGSANLDFAKIESGLLSPEETDALTGAADELRSKHLDLMDVSDLNVQTLRSVVKRHRLETDDRLGLVVIDYLQLLSASRPGQTEYEKVSEITRTLKIMAKELSVPVVALSQMNRDSERAGAKPREPRVSDLRGSGSVEQDADAVIFLHQVSEQDDVTTRSEGRDLKVIVGKNRFGPTGDVSVKFYPWRQRFTEVAVGDDGETASAVPAHVRTSDTFDSDPSDDEDLFG